MGTGMPIESDVARIRFKLNALRNTVIAEVRKDMYVRDVDALLDAVDIAREGRELAEQRAKESVQQEMAGLRSQLSAARLDVLRGLPRDEIELIRLGCPVLCGRLAELAGVKR